jgi:hypothetical protein
MIDPTYSLGVITSSLAAEEGETRGHKEGAQQARKEE